MDLGCHVGTMSVPAAALGRHVLAVDASPLHVEAVRRSAERNQLGTLKIRWCAVARERGEIAFNENGLWGMVWPPGKAPPDALRVPALPSDALVRDAGWSHIDFVKMDVEGSELAAIEGLAALMTGEKAPVIVYESNGMTFELFGYDIVEVRTRLEELGYVTCRIEHDRLVYCPPLQLQPEAWLDVVALPPRWHRVEALVTPEWTDDEIVARCMEWGTNEHRNVREYLHKAFDSASEYPRSDARIIALRRDLDREFGSRAV